MGNINRTKAVEVLLDEFENTTEAISTINLIEKFNDRFNKTTIYRNLEKLETDGVLHSFLGKNAIRWYAKCKRCSKSNHSDTHPHFQCVHCGSVDCLPFEIKLPELLNREVISSQILIQGRCENCIV